MLSKLLKHEFAATWKPLAALDAALIFMGLVLHFVAGMLPDAEPSVGLAVVVFSFTAIFYITIIAANIVALVLLVMRYYKNLYTAEGYLTFTLPVSTNSVIATKAISGFVWMFLSYFCTILAVILGASGFVAAAGVGFTEFQEGWQEFQSVFDMGNIWGMAIAFMLVTPIASVMTLYFCVSIGQLWQKHKILGAVLAYVGVYLFNQIVNTVSLFSSGFFRLMVESGADPSMDPSFGGLYSGVLYRSLIISALEAIVAYIVCVAVSKKQLNLD